MPKIEPEVASFARIKVVGVGGSGKNAVNHMINSKIKGVDFIVMNTDAQDLHHSLAPKKIHIGKNLTRGLGAGGFPDRRNPGPCHASYPAFSAVSWRSTLHRASTQGRPHSPARPGRITALKPTGRTFAKMARWSG